jgi:hypothetical protein
VSGLVINPQKSSMWFSRRCWQQNRDVVLQKIRAKIASEKEQLLHPRNNKSDLG